MENVLILAGEASGDIHGAELIKEMKKISEINFLGIGGDRMMAEGMDLNFHIKDMAFLGFVEVVKHLPFIMKVQKEILRLVKERKIRKAVLIDYPGFNLNIAKKLKRLGVKVYYYISPQIWAWGRKRIKKIKERVDKMIVVFPFEKEFYNNAGVDVDFVGHPLIQKIEHYSFCDRKSFCEKNNLQPEKEILLLMPGSRKHEISKIFPDMIKAADMISHEFNLQIVVACPENIDEKIFDSFSDYTFKVIHNQSYDLMKHSKFGLVKSGTSTMEAAIIGLPFVVLYSTSALTYFIGRMLIKVGFIAMPNIIAGREIVKEFIQKDINAANVFAYVKRMLNDQLSLNLIKEEFGGIKKILGSRSASKLAAEIICS